MNTENINLSDDERLDYINEDLSLIQLKSGLTFGTDAYLLAAFCRGSGGRLADLGSGTGVAAFLCLTKKKCDSVIAYEIQPRFAGLIDRNAAINGLSDKIRVICRDVRDAAETDIGSPLEAVISNPPYMKAGGGMGNAANEKNIARRELNGTIADFAAAAARLLKFGGLFYTVYRPDRLCDLFCALRDNNLEPKRLVTVYPDASSKPCLVLCESKKGASSGLLAARALIIYGSSRSYTEDMAKIYETCSTEHLFN